jgi:hypothetical protein
MGAPVVAFTKPLAVYNNSLPLLLLLLAKPLSESFNVGYYLRWDVI